MVAYCWSAFVSSMLDNIVKVDRTVSKKECSSDPEFF